MRTSPVAPMEARGATEGRTRQTWRPSLDETSGEDATVDTPQASVHDRPPPATPDAARSPLARDESPRPDAGRASGLSPTTGSGLAAEPDGGPNAADTEPLLWWRPVIVAQEPVAAPPFSVAPAVHGVGSPAEQRSVTPARLPEDVDPFGFGTAGTLLDDYPFCTTLATRWQDNAGDGVLDPSVHHQLFDMLIRRFLLDAGVNLAPHEPLHLLTVENTCRYFAPLAYPETVLAALAVERLGDSSVTCRMGLFREGQQSPRAEGRSVHVFVDRSTRRPCPMPAVAREALVCLLAIEDDPGPDR